MSNLFHSPDKIAGLLSVVAALVFLPMWYIILFVAPAPNFSAFESAIGSLKYLISQENASRQIFLWLIALPISCALIGTAYLLDLARSKAVAKLLFVLSCSMGIAALFWMDFTLSFFVILPTYWGYRCVSRT